MSKCYFFLRTEGQLVALEQTVTTDQLPYVWCHQLNKRINCNCTCRWRQSGASARL